MSITNSRYSFIVRSNAIFTTLFLLVLFSHAHAQSTNYTKSTADSNLRGNLEVDPSTLGMSFNLPMGGYGGRGATLPISLTYSSKVWRMEHTMGYDGPLYYINEHQTRYAEKSVAGWTSSTGVPYLEYTGSEQVYNLYPGDTICLTCNPLPEDIPYYVPRVLLHLPDGSTHELRKNDTVVNAANLTYTGVFVAVDGSRIKYNFDNATLYLPDGSRYWLAAPNGVQYFDRNGNTLTYNTTTNQWTDTLGRVISTIPLNNSVVGDVDYLLPGVGGVNQKFTLRWKKLGDAGVMTVSEPLRFKGDRKFGQWSVPVSPSLFTTIDWSLRIVASGASGTEFNPTLLHEIILPNGASYKFTYNVCGEVDKVLLPSGGYERFEYAKIPALSDIDTPYTETNRGVVKHWVSPTGNAADEVLTNYASTGTIASVTNAGGSRAERTLIPASGNTHFGFEDSRTGRASEERTYNASNQMMRRTLVEWVQDGPLPGGNAEATRNPRSTRKIEILLDTGTNDAIAATTTYEYDADLNQTVMRQYDYVTVDQYTAQNGTLSSFSLGNLLRTQETIYLVNDYNIPLAIRQTYRDRNLLSLPTWSTTKNASGTIVAQTEFRYDEVAYAPLAVTGTPTGWANPNTNYRGNVTTTRSWLNTNNSWLETHAQYDVLGNPRYAWDAKGLLSQIEYNDSFSDASKNTLNTYAFATKAITPVPDPSGVKGSATTLQSTTIYEYWTGRTVSTTDANNKTTSFEYEPVLGSGYNSLNRPTRIVRPDGGETLFEYGDTSLNWYERIRTKQNATTWVETYTYLDGLSREYRTATNEGSNSWTVKDTQYDNLGRAYKASNSYRYAGTNPKLATPPANEWTINTFDAINRVLTVTTPDNSVVSNDYKANKSTATDQAGKQRKSETDALGRIINVWEAPNAENFLTTHTYDALGKLTQVNQGGQLRNFVYDSLGRLTSATDNESGTKTYTYDANGNTLTMTDARGITTNYAYDNLNRNTTISYSNYLNGTSNAEYFYDLAPNGKGKFRYNITYNTLPNGNLVYAYNNVNNYDAVGRVTSYSQNFLVNQGGWTWKPFTTTRTYDLGGNVTAQTYPSGRTVNFAYDTAGRMTSFTGNLGDGVSRNYSTSMKYDAAGHLTKETFGTTTPLYQRMNYNVRQQLYAVRVGTYSGTQYDDDPLQSYYNQGSSWDRGMLIWHYGSAGATNDYSYWGKSGTNNNGNVLRAHHFILGAGVYYDDYEYDNLNRLKKVTENGNAYFVQAFDYDRWGNRQVNAPLTSDFLNEKQFQINTTNNRIKAPTDTGAATDKMRYDAAGNLYWDEYTDTTAQAKWRGYDAAGKLGVLKTSETATADLARYIYDASGKRVRSIVNGVEKWFVYGIGGEMVAEYTPTANQTAPSKEYGYRGGEMLIVAEGSNPKWLITDTLGSTRLEIELNGTTVTRHDYLPFGEELSGSVRSGNGYGNFTNTKQKFTGYERDDESSLDFAQARYYANLQGRFTSPDPLLSSGIVIDPQSWNRYTYVGNRPTIATDPDGLIWAYHDDNGVRTYRWFATAAEATKAGFTAVKGNHVYIGVNGHLITLWSTGGFTDWGKIQRINYRQAEYDDAVQQASQRTDSIIIEWVVTSVTTAVPLGRAAKGGVKLTKIIWELTKDQFTSLVEGKFTEAVCFTAGTLVWTNKGLTPIEEIQGGDTVLSYDIEAQRLEYKSVERTVIRESNSVYNVAIQGESQILRVTANHPFYARLSCPSIEYDGKWIRVDELRPGYEVLNPDGRWASVASVRQIKGVFTVYNFEVADNHNYFVGKSGVLVHNGNCYDHALQALKDQKGGHIYVMEGSRYDDGGLVKEAKMINDAGVYKQTYYEHAVLIKDGKVYDKLGGFDGVPYKEWAKAVNVGKYFSQRSWVNRIRRVSVAAAQAKIDRN